MPRGSGSAPLPDRSLARAALAIILILAGSNACRRDRPRLSRGDAAVVVLQAPLAVPPGIKTVVRESDARKGDQATPVVISLPAGAAAAEGGPVAIEGTLEAGPKGTGEEDLYLVELPPAAGGTPPAPGDVGVPATHQISVEITPAAALATRLVMREPGPAPADRAAQPPATVLASSRAGPGKRHGLPNVAAALGGRYLLSVRGADRPKSAPGKSPAAGAPEAYLLILRVSPLGAADEREPNDTAAAATPAGPAHTEPQLAGYLGGPGDKDLFRIPFGHLAGSSRFLVELAPPAEAAAVLTAIDPGGRIVAQSRGRRGERIVLRGLTPGALGPANQPAAGFFFVEVATEGAGDPFRRYVLGVRTDAAPEAEPPPAVEPGAALP